jgi:uncharacterized OB-fold protein
VWEKVSDPDKAQRLYGSIPVYHRYTLGVAGERFFKALRDEKVILASRCPKCGDAFVPPKIYCERCFEETTDWFPVSDVGYVKNFTIMHYSLDEEPLGEPEIIGVIGWEGVRGGLVHRIGGIAPQQVETGMSLEPAWADQRQGSISDIAYFAPAT